MNKELEKIAETLQELLDTRLKISTLSKTNKMKREEEAVRIAIDYINNSTSNYVLYDLAREMRHNGSNYWADRLCERIKK